MDAGIARLLHLREQTEAVGVDMVFERTRFDLLRDEASRPRTVTAFNLFQTPPAIADKMAALVVPELNAGSVVLEPSAGLGRLYRAIRAAGHSGPVVMVEASADCCRELYTLTNDDPAAELRQGDFLTVQAEANAVIMNPPFKQGRDIKHILHALELLKMGGLLVGLCYDGKRQNKKIKPLASTWEPLPAGSFKAEGTRAGVVLFTIRKNKC